MSDRRHRASRRRLRRLLGSTGLLAFAATLLLVPVGSAAGAGCFAVPSSCGYPDATNSGLPAGIALTNSGSINAGTPGQVVNARNVEGSITVSANNVTIENSKVLAGSAGSGSAAILVESGVVGTVIRDTTVAGRGGGSQSLEAAVRNWGTGTVAERVYLYNCSDCWEGQGTIRDSYMRVDSIYPGAHAEDIYVCSGTVAVTHSTLLNAEQQTATVFGDTICGGGNSFTVTASLLAGGGFVVYPQANSSSATGTMTITGNRIGRCATSAVYNPKSGGTSCSGGADASGYQPHGGYFGIAAYYYSGAGQVWEGNVWDDSGQPLCPNGNSGCPALTPASEPPVFRPAPPVTPAPAAPAPAPVAAPRGTASGSKSAAAVGDAAKPHAVWRLRSTARAGHAFELDASKSTGPPPISCRWRVESSSGDKVLARRRGCRSSILFRRAGERQIVLEVRGGDGSRDELRRAVRIEPRRDSISPLRLASRHRA